MVKASDSAFEAAKAAYMIYGWLLQEVARETGWDRTIAMNVGVGGRMGAVFGMAVHARCSEQKPDAACIAAALESAYSGIGIDYELQVRDGGVAGRYERCPIYSGLAASGIDHATIRRLCQSIADGEFEQLHQAIPELTGKVKIRESAGDVCLEEFVLAK